MADVEGAPRDFQIETSEISPVVRELSVEVAASRVDKSYAFVVREVGKGAHVKGFRRGKVPARAQSNFARPGPKPPSPQPMSRCHRGAR